MAVNNARTGTAVPEDTGCLPDSGVMVISQELVVTSAAENALHGRNQENGNRFDMGGKKLGYQVIAEKTFPVDLEVVSQDVDLPGEEDARDPAAGAAVFARPEILFRILVNSSSPVIANGRVPATD